MSEVESTDDELVRRSLAGESHAFAQLVEKHQRLVFGVALSAARDAGQAEDVAQEAFVEAWRELPRLRDPARVGSWIAGIARNLARTWHRHTARRRKRETADVPREAVRTPLDSALDRETKSLVHDALAKIPAAYREALVLYYVQGRSVAEVAAGLGITEDLAKQRLSRGRRALRASLETRVEGALEQLGPRKGFTAAVVAAVGASTARKAAASAGKGLLVMKATHVVAVVAVVAIGGLAWHWRSAAGHATTAEPTAHPGEPAHAATIGVRKLASRERHEQLLQAIRSAQEQRLAASPTPVATAAAPSARPSPQLPPIDDPDKEYVQQAMRALVPTIRDCYQQALAKQPTLAGVLVINFTIEGEPGTGGLVTDSTVDVEQSDMKDPGLSECVQDAMYELEIDPPANGGTVKVTYPFTFHPR